jgi:uncharacterized protein YndB with AHSA1/START domain
MNDLNVTSQPKVNDLFIERIFDAPLELVWKAWTDPAQMIRWWGPETFTSPSCKMDFRVGGTYLFCMRSPEGMDFWSSGVYREIKAFERIVYTDHLSDADGNPISPETYGMSPDFPSEMLVTVTFEEHGEGKTRLTLHQAGIPAGQMTEMARAGWNGSLDKLAASLRS